VGPREGPLNNAMILKKEWVSNYAGNIAGDLRSARLMREKRRTEQKKKNYPQKKKRTRGTWRALTWG